MITGDVDDLGQLIEPDGTGSKRKTRWWNSARYTLVLMGFLGLSNVYAMRVNLSVAIVSMVNHTALNNQNKNHSSVSSRWSYETPMFHLREDGATSNSTLDKCPYPEGQNSSTHPVKDGPFVWDESQQGLVLGCFFYGYVASQYPGGRLAELYGGRWIFGLGVLVTAVFTLLTPVAAHTNFVLLVIVRVIEGLGEGVTFPVILAMLARWAPPEERSKMTSFAYGGALFGTIISLPLSGLLCDYLGWETVFYFFGGLGLVWFVAWIFLCYDSPQTHPRIAEDELIYILSSMDEDPTGAGLSSSSRSLPTPWKSILTSPAIYAILSTHITQAFGYYVMLTELPTYLSNILHFDIKSNALLAAVPYLCAWFVSLGTPILADRVMANNWLSRTAVRKLSNSVGTFVPALSLALASIIGCNSIIIIVLFCFAVGSNATVYTGENAAMLDMAPNFAGTIMGIINALANAMGFVAPQLTGYIINNQETLSRWRIVFLIAAVAGSVGNTIFLLFGTAEEQAWNRAVAEDEKEEGNEEVAQEGEGQWRGP